VEALQAEDEMSDRIWTRPFTCRIGLHSWQAVTADPARPPAVKNNPYVVEMECSRCGTRKIVGLSTGHNGRWD
jgi:hypothetical protein